MITRLADVKQYLGITDTEFDSPLYDYIVVADNMLSNYLGGEILNKEIEYQFRPTYNSDVKTLPFQTVNLVSVLSYRTGVTSDWTVIDSNYYVLTDKPNQINYADFLAGLHYKAVLNVGYLDSEIPEMIRQAGVEMTVEMFKQSDIAKGDITGRLGMKAISSNSSASGTLQYTFESVWEKWKRDLLKFKIIATGIK